MDTALQSRLEPGVSICSVDTTLQRRVEPAGSGCNEDITLQSRFEPGVSACNEYAAFQIPFRVIEAVMRPQPTDQAGDWRQALEYIRICGPDPVAGSHV